jgi:hypothetical protein
MLYGDWTGVSDIALPDIAGLVTSALSLNSIFLEHHLPSLGLNNSEQPVAASLVGFLICLCFLSPYGMHASHRSRRDA